MIPVAISILFLGMSVQSLESGGRVPNPVSRMTTCPVPEPDSEARIRRLLTNPLISELRMRFDLGTSTVDDVEVLTNDGDAAACAALRKAMDETRTNLTEKDRATFYRSGDRYFVPITRGRAPSPPGTIHLDGYSSLDVYDSDFRLIGRFMA